MLISKDEELGGDCGPLCTLQTPGAKRHCRRGSFFGGGGGIHPTWMLAVGSRKAIHRLERKFQNSVKPSRL